MPADCVVGQGRAGFIGVNNLAVGHKTKLDKRLEAVADAEHKSVALFKKACNSLLDFRIAEKRGDEFARAVRLVAAREAAGDKDYLAFLDFLCKILNRACDARRRKVVDNKDFSLGSRSFSRLCGIVFAVCARENGNQHLGLRRFNSRLCKGRGFIVKGFYFLFGHFDVAGINILKLILIESEQL